MLKKIQDEIERVMEKTGVMGTEVVNIVVRLTDEEADCFLDDPEYRSSNYDWTLQENGILYLSYSEIDAKRIYFDFIETNDGSVIFVQYTNNRRDKVCYLYDFRNNYCDAFKSLEALEAGGEVPYMDWDNNQIDRVERFNDLFPADQSPCGWQWCFNDILGWVNAPNNSLYRWWKSRDR